MTKSDTRAGRMVLLFILALMLAATAAPAQEPDADADWKPVTVLYMSDVKGKIDPCG